jgi:uncharacterized membrane protein
MEANESTPAGGPQQSLVKLTHVIYALDAASLFIGLTGIVAIVMAYLKRDEARGSFLESHYTWIIRTFWIGLAGAIVGGATMWMFGLGMIIVGAVIVWYIYRVVKGWLALNDGRAIPNPTGIL